MADHDDDLVEAVRELTRTIDDLGDELESPRRRPPIRPPTPREILGFTDDVAIPAALAVLKSSVRTLEAFQRSLELLRTEREVRDQASQAAVSTSDRANEIRQTTLSQLDTVLAELQRAASDGTLPADEQARELLTDARELRDDVDERLRSARSDRETDEPSTGDAIEIDVQDGTPDGSDDSGDGADTNQPNSAVDVDAELETLKDRYEADADEDDAVDSDDETESDETAGGEDADGTDGDDSESAGDDDTDGK